MTSNRRVPTNRKNQDHIDPVDIKTCSYEKAGENAKQFHYLSNYEDKIEILALDADKPTLAKDLLQSILHLLEAF